MSEEHSEPGEGNSPAAWTAVIIMLVGFAVGTVAFFLNLPVIVWSAAALVVVGLIVGAVLSKLGYGVNGPKYVPKDR